MLLSTKKHFIPLLPELTTATPKSFSQAMKRAKGFLEQPPRFWLLAKTGEVAKGSTSKSADVLVTTAAYVALSVINRVAYRMSLQLMHRYTFSLSLFVTMCYTLVYSCILWNRVRRQIVPVSQVKWALQSWPLFALIGTLEAATFVIGMFSASRLPGALLPVLNQGILIFIAVASYVLLGRRYSFTQIVGLTVVLAGVLLSIGPQTVGQAASDLTSGDIWVNAMLFFGSYAFVAVAVVLKERVFKRSGVEPDLFIVNTFSSIMQFVATFIILPFTTSFAVQLAGSSSSQAYFSAAFKAFAGYESRLMPWLALGYIMVNIVFNVTGLRLLKIASALDSVVASLISVPLTTLTFCLPLPLLVQSQFSPMVLLGLGVLLTGIWLYNLPKTTQSAND